MLGKANRLLMSFLLGAVVGAGGMYYWLELRDKVGDQVYTVASVLSHYPRAGDNSETTLQVYIKGDEGHVMELLCLFPPSFSLEGGPSSSLTDYLTGQTEKRGWTGIKKVRVMSKAKEYWFGKVGYYCKKVE
jgi:hypothetical protein